jgi:NADH-quinone oxidoreductase subunit J
LSILTILTINAKEENLPNEPYKFLWIIGTSILVAPFTFLLYNVLKSLPKHFSTLETINSKVTGELLFSKWVLPFEIVSILLLTAMLGAIVIARDKVKGASS